MEIRYTRKLMTSYMRLDEEEKLLPWEEKMIAYVPVTGILFPEYVRENDKTELWYDISGKQSLETILESQKLDYEFLQRLFTGMFEAREQLEGMLLRAEGLLLEPACIFVDYRADQICFCYHPGGGESREGALERLMEMLLQEVAHEDERAVELAYGVYEHAVRGGISREQWQELLMREYRQIEQEAQESEAGTADRSTEENKEERELRESEPEEERTPGKRAVWRRWIQGIREKVSWKPGLRRLEQEKTFFFEPEPEPEEEAPVRPTVLLSTLHIPAEGILHYEGEGAGKDLIIDRSPYTIGSEAACEGRLTSATVSRRHARITQQDGIYFIEDLNSANGTYVGGEQLGYHTKVSLQRNEIVRFADEKFRFI